ncbi:MAG: HDIG domain-containing protein [Anaerolineales bacterium]|nr:HDIG domain-containing protein [Anaerolineales bacterium]
MRSAIVQGKSREGIWPRIIRIIIILITLGLCAYALFIPSSINSGQITLEAGDVAPRDILSPETITFESEILTKAQQDLAAQNVSSVYASPDTSIARTQAATLREALNYIDNVRADIYADQDQKMIDLAAMNDVHFSQETAELILNMNEATWQIIRQEAIVVLEQVMRSTIREDRLEDARRGVPALVSLSLSEENAAIVAEIVSAFVAPNSLYSEEMTEAARDKAREFVVPITRSFIVNETVVRKGKVVTSDDIEALEMLDILNPAPLWQEIVGAISITVLLYALMMLQFRHNKILKNLKNLIVVNTTFLVFLYASQLLLPGNTFTAYIFPVAAFGMVVSVLFNVNLGIWLVIPLSILTAYRLTNGLEMTIYYSITGIFGALVIRRGKRLSSFAWAGIAIAMAGISIILAIDLPSQTNTITSVLYTSAAAMLQGILAASIALVLELILSQILGITTALQLLELARPDQPLLQMILRSAPGTYQHSLQVANLAEQAAEQIGADALLTRVGALYHDVGKTYFPHYFIENQGYDEVNPHRDLNPYDSAAIIIRHVTDGVILANKHRLPESIKSFITEHHGTSITKYQYGKVLSENGGDVSAIDIGQFTYPGPEPRTRETALVMMADGIEARSRAERPREDHEIETLIRSEIKRRLDDGQLDFAPLTLQDLNTIAESFISTMRGIYHPRIHYPQIDDKTRPSGKKDIEYLPSPSSPVRTNKEDTNQR